ncbi:hypothetical protein SGRA_1610 [Saprospira grandis str. Lewin]|uniref:Uncharacterized protein n=1 Tax=Saprospira grandis (strain Lewin) TaxID=984262 RepID=H6L9Y2_SAPGL|nr:hypothetical protein SGRA_1610 [Saprospira grandis str. Lewin]
MIKIEPRRKIAAGLFSAPYRPKGPQAIAKFNRTHFYSLQQFSASRPYFSRP